jgi:NAD(P)-dependent dehydrogenase (short-subunit alcohol dehydrogenase family)
MPIADVSDRTLAQLLSLAGRRAVVTGGGAGIGEATVARLAEAGADVVVADRDGGAAKDVAQRVAEASGRRVLAREVDVTDTEGLAAVADLAVTELGGLEIWVNNAGIYPTTGPIVDATDEFVDRMLEVNVRGTYAGGREAVTRMTGGGVIVNLASTAGFSGARGISAYVASKHAVVGLTKSMANEFGPLGVRVLAVAPTVIQTPGVAAEMEKLSAAGLDISRAGSANPLGRVGVPDDIARVILFCCSDLSMLMTGSTLLADAGSLA